MSDRRTFPSATKPRVTRLPTSEGFEHSGGFTLIEIMLAVAIVGVLSSLAIPNYLGFVEKARVARAVAEMNAIAEEVRGYALSTELYPDSLGQVGLSAPLDPWGNPYQYYRINCGVAIIGRLDTPESPAIGSVGPVLPVSVVLPSVKTHISFAVDEGGHQGLIHPTAGGGGGGGGGGDGRGGGGGGGEGGPPCGGIGGARKVRFLVPINSDFDLYSMGKDGQSVGPLTAQKSHDDVIRANDGSYYGLASNF
ncbi:MAG: prepilin-type N-terminal cleavage/methylation domain-containing protein [Nitrospira sp.]|nr:prepilin-type N-terminal cleavage/methylation domain-containing protein [Nitrospira sp.]